MRELAQLTIHLDHLAHNINCVRSITQKNIIMMVKANAYGNGLVEITRFAHNELNINTFGVASLGEALSLKKELSDFTGEIFVFSENNLRNPGNVNYYQDKGIYPVLWNVEDFDIAIKNDLPIILKFNTGMNRLGIDVNDAALVAQKLKKKKLSIKHLMTHFSSANLVFKPGDRTEKQLALFKELKEAFKNEKIDIEETSVANSAAIEQKIGLDESHIRPGLMLYGPSGVLRSNQYQGKIISSLESEVFHLLKAKKGTPIGYGGHILDSDANIAYLPIGYGDGVPYNLSGLKLDFDFGSARVLGRVNMDMMALKIDSNANIKVGDRVKLWSADRNFYDWCNHLKTIPYEIMCAISHRLPRVYRLQ